MKERIEKLKLEDSALIIIDMQNDFVLEGAPVECGEPGRATISVIQKLKVWAKKNNIPVIYTQEYHRPDLVDFGIEAEHEPPHTILGTPGEEIIDELKPDKDDYIIHKPRYSGYNYTDMPLLLSGLRKTNLIICGVCTDICVYSTAKDASQAGYHVVVVSDACAASREKYQELFLDHIEFIYGDVHDSETVMSIIK